MISKVFCKLLVSFRPFQILEISDLAMAKGEKVNIAVTYWAISKDIFKTFERFQMGLKETKS
jgi:hypothetical protein